MTAGTFKPLISWDGQENLQGCARSRALEQKLGDTALVFNSNQAAISACLELMGSRVTSVPVVMPVTAPVDALMGVIKIGAVPILIDVSELDLQADLEDLQTALEALENAVVYFPRPGGLPVRQELLEAAGDCPTIIDSRLPPVEKSFLGTFNLYDLSGLVGCGSVLFHKHEEQLKELQIIRSEMGTDLPEICSALVYKRLAELKNTVADTKEYAELLDISSKNGIIGFKSITPAYTFLIQVNDATEVLSILKEKRYQAQRGLIPLYKYPHVKKRWQEEPDYPVAEKLMNRLILLPNNAGVDKRELLEIIYGKKTRKEEASP